MASGRGRGQPDRPGIRAGPRQAGQRRWSGYWIMCGVGLWGVSPQ